MQAQRGEALDGAFVVVALACPRHRSAQAVGAIALESFPRWLVNGGEPAKNRNFTTKRDFAGKPYLNSRIVLPIFGFEKKHARSDRLADNMLCA
jgi:hypothetical protein